MTKSNPRNVTYQHVYLIALELFGFDKDRTNMWWSSKREELNNLSPFEMVREGKGRELMKIINRCL